MVINPHFANLPHVTSPVSQTVNQGQVSQGINALADLDGLSGAGFATGATPGNPTQSQPPLEAGAAIGYNPSPVQTTPPPGTFGGQSLMRMAQPGRMSMPTGLLPPTGLESQPIAMPGSQPTFNVMSGVPVDQFDHAFDMPNDTVGLGAALNPIGTAIGRLFTGTGGAINDMFSGLTGAVQRGLDPGTYTMPNTQPNPDHNPYSPVNMQLNSGAQLVDPAEAAARSQYAHAMPQGLTEQQQFDYLNPRGPDGRPLYQY